MALLSECYRVLRPGGTLRISTPNLEKVLDDYHLGRTPEWRDAGYRADVPCQMLNGGMRLFGHQFIYDARELKRVLDAAGFRNVVRVGWHESATPALSNLETRPFRDDLIFEAVK